MTAILLVVGMFMVGLMVAVFVEWAEQKPIRSQQRAAAQLPYAVRLLDQVLTADSVMPALPQSLRDEIEQFTTRHYKEIDK